MCLLSDPHCRQWVLRREGRLEVQEWQFSEEHCRRTCRFIPLLKKHPQHAPASHHFHSRNNQEVSKSAWKCQVQNTGITHSLLRYCVAFPSCPEHAPMHIRNTGKLKTVANKCTKISLASIALLGGFSLHLCTKGKHVSAYGQAQCLLMKELRSPSERDKREIRG